MKFDSLLDCAVFRIITDFSKRKIRLLEYILFLKSEDIK